MRLTLAVRLSYILVITGLLLACEDQQAGESIPVTRQLSNLEAPSNSDLLLFFEKDRGASEKDSRVLSLASGKVFPLSELNDSLLLINYWAIWCAPCRLEIPELNALYAERQVKVLGIDFDRRQGQELQSAINDMGISFPVLTAQSAADLQLEWPEALPVTLIVINRRLSKTLLGPQTKEALDKAILLAKGKSG